PLRLKRNSRALSCAIDVLSLVGRRGHPTRSGLLMKRREFITLLGSAAAPWPVSARAQEGERMRRIGVLLPASENDSEYPGLVQVFLRELRQLGWTEANSAIDIRWAGAAPEGIRKNARELAVCGKTSPE